MFKYYFLLLLYYQKFVYSRQVHFAERVISGHMQDGSPKYTEKNVTWETLGSEASAENVVSSGSHVGGRPYVSICLDRSKKNCKKCILELVCSASLSPERI